MATRSERPQREARVTLGARRCRETPSLRSGQPVRHGSKGASGACCCDTAQPGGNNPWKAEHKGQRVPASPMVSPRMLMLSVLSTAGDPGVVWGDVCVVGG